MKHILIFTGYFYPENQIINDFIFSLNKNYRFTVITAFPNYPNRKLFKRYKIWKDSIDNQYENITILRIPVIYRKGNNLLFLFLNYISYVFSSIVILPYLLFKKFDNIFVYLISPFSITVAPLLMNLFKKIKINIWVLDLWPETLEIFNFPFKKKILRIIFYYTQFFYSRCSNIFVSSLGFKKSASLNKFEKKTFFIPQWQRGKFDKKSSINLYKFPKLPKKSIKILFAGNFGKAQNLDCVFKAIKELKTDKNIYWFFVGDGSEKLNFQKKIYDLETNNVFIYNQVSLEDVSNFYVFCDLFLIPLIDHNAINSVLPAKLQYCLNFGKPIITLSSGEISNFIKQNKLGLVANSNDYKKLCKNIISISKYKKKQLDEINKNSQKLILNEFNKKKLISSMCNIAFETNS